MGATTGRSCGPDQSRAGARHRHPPDAKIPPDSPTAPAPPEAAKPPAPPASPGQPPFAPGPFPPSGALPPGGPQTPLPPGAGPGIPFPPAPGLPPTLPVPPGGFGLAPSLPGGPVQPPGLPGSPMLPLTPPGAGPGLAPMPGAPSPGWGTLLADLPYGSDPLQRLDLYEPRGGGPAPMLLFVHGGGWSIGDKTELSWLGAKLAEQGVLVAVTNYRLSPAVQHPAHAQDVARAVAWLYRNGPSYGGDPQRLYIGGHSAGAHLASLVALDDAFLGAEGLSPSVIRSVVGVSGAGYDLDARYAASPLAQIFYAAFGKDPTRWALAAPLHYVAKGAPPFLLVHGLNDGEAPAAGAETFAQALKADGAKIRLELLPGLDHQSALVAALPSLRAFVQ